MRFVDGYMLSVARRRLRAYRRLARLARTIWRDAGALDHRMVHSRDSESVLFSWITFRSRAHRDRVRSRVMKDKRLAGRSPELKRLITGGIKVVLRV